ncbi:DUF4157 domain-containing protein [Streptomyces toxytricini]|uniref:eCIS core domain-containing protein n=1 Tax=Streptomyces TaxID=1883 RepID=UPI003570D607
MHEHDHAHRAGPDAGSRLPQRAPAPPPARPGGLPGLQAAAGNTAVVQMLRHAGHTWAQPEQHQHTADCGHQQTGLPPVQRSAVHDVLQSPGRPMDEATRTDMEYRLGADFSDVRIHDDGAAKASAAEVGARAYTSGNHIVIGDGGDDLHTLAHELTHVIQQRRGPVAGTDNGAGLKVSDPSDQFEREAEANATRALQRAPAPAPVEKQAPPHPGGTEHHGVPIQRILHRKDFNATTKQVVAVAPGQHRRHVIDHALMRDALANWWTAHSANAAAHTYLQSVNHVQQMLNDMNNNPNNLWPGDGPDNSAIGMLSHHMTARINTIQAQGLTGQAAFDTINQFHGFEQIRQAQLARPFYEAVRGMTNTGEIVRYLRDVQSNAGLDLPYATGRDFSEWEFLYQRFEHLRDNPGAWSEALVLELFSAFMNCPIAQ